MLKSETGKLQTAQDLCTSAFLSPGLVKLAPAISMQSKHCYFLIYPAICPSPRKQNLPSDKHRPTHKPTQTI